MKIFKIAFLPKKIHPVNAVPVEVLVEAESNVDAEEIAKDWFKGNETNYKYYDDIAITEPMVLKG